MIGFVIGLWLGATLTALSYVRRHNAWGAVAHYRGWEWLFVPYFSLVGLWQTRWTGNEPRSYGGGHTP